MTIPSLMNCSHSGDGWCLDCVLKEIHRLQLTKEELEVIDGVAKAYESHDGGATGDRVARVLRRLYQRVK